MNVRDLLHGLNGLCLLPQWWLQSAHKRNPYLWVFGAWDGLRYSDNSRALYEYTLEHLPQIHSVWVTDSDAIYKQLKQEGKPVEMFHSKEGIKVQKDAGFVFVTKGMFDVVNYYMNGAHYINLWHGVPIKKIGEDALLKLRKQTIIKKLKTSIRRLIVPWEFISGKMISGSPFFSPFLKSAFLLQDEAIWETPEARLDMLSVPKKEQLVLDLDKKFDHPLKVIYMPTFRDAEFGVFNPFKEADFDLPSFLSVLEKKNIVFIYKGHFFDCNVKGLEGQERIITVGDTDYDNLYTFIKDMDILVTDYSSVYFDFLFLKRPMILFPFDYDIYVEKSREFYFDYKLMASKRVLSWKEMAQCLDDESYYVPSDEEVKLFRSLPAQNCCQQIANKVLEMIG